MEQINRTNCKNCGAPLHYDLENRLAKCEYCSSEYHLDNLGIIEEYKVELEIFGQRRTFYINSITQEYDNYKFDCGYDFTGKSYIIHTGGNLTIELVEYF